MGGSLAVISKYNGALQNLKRDDMIVGLIESSPAIHRIKREIQNDRTLKAAVRAGDIAVILNSATVVRLLEDEQLAQSVERHRDVLFEALLNAVPTESRDHAYEQLAKLRGMPVKEFKEYANKRIAASQEQRRREEQSTPDTAAINGEF